MRRIGIASTFVLLAAVVLLKEAASQANLINELAPGVYYRTAEPDKRIIANTGWVVFRDYVLVIDANYPWGAKPVLADIRRTTNKPVRFVFDTHYHADHAFGNSVMTDAGATVVCSAECAEESRRKNGASWEKTSGEAEYSLKPYRLEHPQMTFSGRMVFDDGEHRVELIRLGPGHTLGDAVAWLPKERILFTGDLCVNQAGNNVADPDADPDNWIRALDSMALMDVARVIPGHGSPGGAETIRGQRAYLAELVNGVRSAVGKGAPAEQALRAIDLSRHKPWGQNTQRNEVSIKAVYAKLSGK
jgi:glyoxylase-like metal-dependent hydrolase (beta-lactamase superfamily II)